MLPCMQECVKIKGINELGGREGMRRLTEWLKRIIPQNLWPLFIVWFVQNAAVYYVARLII